MQVLCVYRQSLGFSLPDPLVFRPIYVFVHVYACVVCLFLSVYAQSWSVSLSLSRWIPVPVLPFARLPVPCVPSLIAR